MERSRTLRAHFLTRAQVVAALRQRAPGAPSLTRYRGDQQKEKDYFDQFRMALDPADIARSIVFALDQPPHVQIAEMMILPVNRY